MYRNRFVEGWGGEDVLKNDGSSWRRIHPVRLPVRTRGIS